MKTLVDSSQSRQVRGSSVSEYFDAMAPSWDDRYKRSRLFRRRYRIFEQAILRYGAPCRRALDYGCGSGILAGLLSKSIRSVVATDISEKMREVTRRKFEEDPHVKVAQTDDLQQAGFDLAVCSSVIEYAEDPEELMATLSGYLEPGGLLLITFSNKYAPLQMANRYLFSRFNRAIYTNVQRSVFSKRSILKLARRAHLVPLRLHTPIGLPMLSLLGLGELFFLVARKEA